MGRDHDTPSHHRMGSSRITTPTNPTHTQRALPHHRHHQPTMGTMTHYLNPPFDGAHITAHITHNRRALHFTLPTPGHIGRCAYQRATLEFRETPTRGAKQWSGECRLATARRWVPAPHGDTNVVALTDAARVIAAREVAGWLNRGGRFHDMWAERIPAGVRSIRDAERERLRRLRAECDELARRVEVLSDVVECGVEAVGADGALVVGGECVARFVQGPSSWGVEVM